MKLSYMDPCGFVDALRAHKIHKIHKIHKDSSHKGVLKKSAREAGRVAPVVPMHPAALPGGAEHADDRGLQPVVGVGDHQLDAEKPAGLQALQEVRPEDLGLRRADVQADDLTISRRPSVLTATAIIAATDTIRPAARTLGGIEPEVRPFADQGAVEETARPVEHQEGR